MLVTDSTSLSQILATAFDETGLSKESVAAEMGRNPATVYRILAAGSASKPNVLGIVRAINKLAMCRVIDESLALRSAGYAPEPTDVNSDLIASVIDNIVYLPESVQEDLLEQVKALRRRYAV